ncbi:MAG: hypothetical protein ACREX6_10860 [Casimicrobiaceae bacterium]
MCTPLVFNLTRRWAFDNLLGQLSYPVYLSHVLVIGIAKRVDLGPLDKGLVAIVVTLGLSAALYAFVDRPVEHLRKRIAAARIGVPRAAAALARS